MVSYFSLLSLSLKFVLVLNSKKNELNKLKRQLESYEHNKDTHGADDEVIHAGYHSGTDDERSSDAFANLRERSRSPVQTTASLNDLDRSPGGAGKRSKYATSDTDTSGDDEPFVDDEVQHVSRSRTVLLLI